MKPILFLDFDDVICVNAQYGGYDVLAPNPPDDLWSRLFHPPAVGTLLQIMDEHVPVVVITTSWLRFLTKEGLVQVLRKTGLGPVAEALHHQWEAPQVYGKERVDAIDRWLKHYHRGEPYVILDDAKSGTGLRQSKHAKAGWVVFCEENAGLHAGHLPAVRKAFAMPSESAKTKK